MTDILIALGANQAPAGTDLTSTILNALYHLEREYPVSVRQVSRMYSSPAWPPGSGPDFINAVAKVETELHAPEFLQVLHEVEAHFGRQRRVRWGPRVLDLDLIAYGQMVLPNAETVASAMQAHADGGVIPAPEELVLPHPRMQDRSFVLRPAHDVAPDWTHPILGQSITDLLKNRPLVERESVRPMP